MQEVMVLTIDTTIHLSGVLVNQHAPIGQSCRYCSTKITLLQQQFRACHLLLFDSIQDTLLAAFYKHGRMIKHENISKTFHVANLAGYLYV